MAEVMLQIGGHQYQVACRDGEEPHLQKIAAMVDEKMVEARSAVGDMGEVRQLLLASLLLADELIELRKAPLAAANGLDSSSAPAELLEQLAQRIESVVAKLENG